jgi:hypothetical protein
MQIDHITARRRVVWVSAAAAAALAITGTAQAGLPSGVGHVTVTQGTTTQNIDGHLHAAGAIHGVVKSGSTVLTSASASAYKNGQFVRSGFQFGSGGYTIPGLSTGKYKVCVNSFSIFGGPSKTGYTGRCYKTAAFNNTTPPSSATDVKVTAGKTTNNININVPKGAAVSGKVKTPGGSALPFVTVTAHNRSNGQSYVGITLKNGTYKITGLSSSAKGYTVCANPVGVQKGTGYRPRCYKKTAWNGTTFPSSATKVSVSAGHTHTGVNITVPVGGAVSGTVKSTAGKALKGIGVLAYSKGGKFLSSAATNGKGKYKIRGLAASKTDRICAAPSQPSPSVRYDGKCWKNASWKGLKLPSGANSVRVRTGHTHTGISFKLKKHTIKLGSIAGKITESASSSPLQNAYVEVFTKSGNFVNSTSTSSTGAYLVKNLVAGTYVVCTLPSSAFSGSVSTPDTGWAPRCYKTAAWKGGALPSGATKFALSAGQHKTGVNIAVHVGGAISGTTFQGGGSTPATGITVDLFTAGGAFLKSTSSGFGDGTYTFTGLVPASGGYVVCFDGRNAFAGTGYLPQCYNNKAWSGTF